MKCDDDPYQIPTIPELMQPPPVKPGWDFGGGIKRNWKTIMDALKALLDKLKK